MGKAITIFGSFALVLFGVQICQFGFVPNMLVDYESFYAGSDTTASKAGDQKEKTIGSALSMEWLQGVDSTRASSHDNEILSNENAELKKEIERLKKSLVDTVPDMRGEDKDVTVLSIYDNSYCDGRPKQSVQVKGSNRTFVQPTEFPGSFRVQGSGMVELFIRQSQDYQGILMEGDGCYNVPQDQRATRVASFQLHSARLVDFLQRQQIPESLQQQFSTAPDTSQPQTRIIFSAQSSHYFGYQILASAYSFLHSNQTNASWMRLLTSRVPDDLSERFPTFSAPKTLYSRLYTPINKPDVIMKWFLSKDAPHPDDTIILVDPDSWLLLDMHQWTQPVEKGLALGQEAYYSRQAIVQEMWKEICLENCQNKIDMVGVPYILKASDLEAVAPLWKKYSLLLKEKLKQDSFARKYGHLGFDWAAEMIGYNAACAHLNIRSKVTNALQVRDIESSYNTEKWIGRPTIHVGRAWFPMKDARMAAPWQDADDGGTNNGQRIQVWCKCNTTAAEIQPWPIPAEDMDFVSKHTLTILHKSKEYFGPVPVNRTFRNPASYYQPTE